MEKTRLYAIIGVIMIAGVLAGAVYASRVGGQVTVLNASDGIPGPSVDERVALENEAIQIALDDPRVKPLVEGKEVIIQAVFKTHFQLKFVDNSTETFYAQWDGKYRTNVYLRYPDNTGYSIEVNITDKIVDEPRAVIWGDGGIFKFAP